MTIFVAVVYVCLSGMCEVIYSPVTYNTETQCKVDIDRELKTINGQYPQATFAPACIPVSFKGA